MPPNFVSQLHPDPVSRLIGVILKLNKSLFNMKSANKYLYLTSALAIVCGVWVLNIGLKRALPVISPDTNKTATSLSPLEWSASRKQEAINQAKTADRKNIDAFIESMIDGSADPVNSASPHMYSTNAKLLEPPFIKKASPRNTS